MRQEITKRIIKTAATWFTFQAQPQNKKKYLRKFLIFSRKKLYPKNFIYFRTEPNLTIFQLPGTISKPKPKVKKIIAWRTSYMFIKRMSHTPPFPSRKEKMIFSQILDGRWSSAKWRKKLCSGMNADLA